jgi:hypothetical protein
MDYPTGITVSGPGPRQPPHAVTMDVGDTWTASFEYLEVDYTRLNSTEAQHLLLNPHFQSYEECTMYGPDGSGKKCPRCGKLFILIEKTRDYADDMRADQEGIWVCEDSQCGMRKHEVYRGYGSIFNNQS